MADFVRDVPRSHVLTLRWICRDPEPGEPLDGPELPASTLVKDAIAAASASSRPIRVVDGDRLAGVVDRVDLLTFLSGLSGLSGQPDQAGQPDQPGLSGRPGQETGRTRASA